MPIPSDLFEAYLKCATKCFLRSRGETGTGNTYANWVKAEQLSYSSEGIKHLVEGVAEDECVTGAIDSKELRSPKWRLAIQTIAMTPPRAGPLFIVCDRCPCLGNGSDV